jgi:DNA recombination protein RmuC
MEISLAFVVGFTIGGFLVYLITSLNHNNAKQAFSALSREALSQNSDEFLKLANATLTKQTQSGIGDLELRKQAVEALVKPIKETLDNIEKERRDAYGGLKQMTETLSKETRGLSQALRSPQVRGRWGETTLRRAAELTGMVDKCDFSEQVSISSEDGIKRPDMIVYLPNHRQIIVDAKTPLDAYLDSVEANDEGIKADALMRHARHVRERFQELSAKSYWATFKSTPEFVVLFLPGEPFLSAALKEDPGLLEEAMEKKVVLASPATLFCLLNSIRYGWREEQLTENALRISTLGKELYDRITIWGNHLKSMGTALKRTVEAYNDGISSLERNVLTSVRHFKELGISSEKDLSELSPVDTTARELSKLE